MDICDLDWCLGLVFLWGDGNIMGQYSANVTLYDAQRAERRMLI